MSVPRATQRLAEEALGGTGVAPGGEPEVARLPVFINGPVKVFVFAYNPSVCFNFSIALRGALEIMAATLLQLWAVGLNPPPDQISHRRSGPIRTSI